MKYFSMFSGVGGYRKDGGYIKANPRTLKRVMEG